MNSLHSWIPGVSNPDFVVLEHSLVETCEDPQILEGTTIDGIILYFRWNNDCLTVRTKFDGKIITSGYPILFKGKQKLPLDQIILHTEIYSKCKIQFK